MQELVFPAPAQTLLAVDGTSARFPVRRVYCVGRNYDAHLREMGNVPGRDLPLFFSKFPDGLVPTGTAVPYPPGTENLHFEMELVVALKGGGADIPVDKALDLVFGYAAGCDLTRRDLQAAAQKAGKPWEPSKAFDFAGPISPIRPAGKAPDPKGRIWLSVNGDIKQDALLKDMIWNVAEIIAQASKLWRLEAGDLIFTGTPEGVGPLQKGDRVDGGVDQVGSLSFTIA